MFLLRMLTQNIFRKLLFFKNKEETVEQFTEFYNESTAMPICVTRMTEDATFFNIKLSEVQSAKVHLLRINEDKGKDNLRITKKIPINHVVSLELKMYILKTFKKSEASKLIDIESEWFLRFLRNCRNKYFRVPECVYDDLKHMISKSKFTQNDLKKYILSNEWRNSLYASCIYKRYCGDKDDKSTIFYFTEFIDKENVFHKTPLLCIKKMSKGDYVTDVVVGKWDKASEEHQVEAQSATTEDLPQPVKSIEFLSNEMITENEKEIQTHEVSGEKEDEKQAEIKPEDEVDEVQSRERDDEVEKDLSEEKTEECSEIMKRKKVALLFGFIGIFIVLVVLSIIFLFYRKKTNAQYHNNKI